MPGSAPVTPFAAICAAIIAYIGMTAAIGLAYLALPPSPDQSIFDYMAWLAAHGAPWYSGAFDMTWPGQLVFHQIGLALFGVHSWTARAMDLLLLQPAMIAICGFAWAAGYRRAALILLFVYPPIYLTSGGWMAGHRDIVGAHLLVGAAAALLLGGKGQDGDARRGWRFVAGVLAGYAVMIRPTYLLFAALAAVVAVLADRRRGVPVAGLFARQAAYVAGGLGVALAFLLAGLATDTLAAWYESAIRFSLEAYQDAAGRGRLPALFVATVRSHWAWLAPAAVLGWLVWLRWGTRGAQQALFLSIAFTVVLSWFVQNKGFAYHLGGLIQLMVIAAAIGLDILIGRIGSARSRTLAAGLAVAIGGLLTLGIGVRMAGDVAPDLLAAARRGPAFALDRRAMLDPKADARRAMVAIIRAESAAGDPLYQWGWGYDAPWLAQRPSPTRFINVPALWLLREDQPHFGGWIARFREDLATRPPLFVLVEVATLTDEGGVDAAGTIAIARVPSAAGRALAQRLNARYRLRAAGGGYLLYRLAQQQVG